MSLNVAQVDIIVSAASATEISGTLVQYNVTEADRQTLYIFAVFDDQGDSSGRTLTVSWNGVNIAGNEIKRGTLNGPYVGLFRVTNPTGTGGLATFLLSSSPAFNNRNWAVGFIVVNDNNQSTPNGTVVASETQVVTSSTTAVPTDPTDIVLSLIAIDNKTAASVGPNSSMTQRDEDSGLGGVYVGIATMPGTGSTVNTDWGSGTTGAWSGTSPNVIEFSLALKEDTGVAGNLSAHIGEPICGSSVLN